MSSTPCACVCGGGEEGEGVRGGEGVWRRGRGVCGGEGGERGEGDMCVLGRKKKGGRTEVKEGKDGQWERECAQQVRNG